MDKVKRTSLRILAKSTRVSLGENDLSQSLEKAASTGDQTHYERAGEEFRALPSEDKTALQKQAHSDARVTRQKIRDIEAVKAGRVGQPAPAETGTGKSWGVQSGSSNSLTKRSVNEIPLSVKKPASDDPTLLDDTEKNDWSWQTLPEDNVGPKKKPQNREDKAIADLRKDLLGPGNKIDW